MGPSVQSNGRQTGAYLPQRSVTNSDHWAPSGSDRATIYAGYADRIPLCTGLTAMRQVSWTSGSTPARQCFYPLPLFGIFFGVAADQCRHTFRARCRFRELRDQLQRAGKTPKAAIIVGPNWRPIGHYVS
jgi:hypothetical protein